MPKKYYLLGPAKSPVIIGGGNFRGDPMNLKPILEDPKGGKGEGGTPFIFKRGVFGKKK